MHPPDIINDQRKVSIVWRNLQCNIPSGVSGCLTKSAPKPILCRLNGYFEYGRLNGIMGPSGAGKTTLLNCLGGRIRKQLTKESEIYLQASSDPNNIVTYFIEKHVHENIAACLTVDEIFRYSFKFKNSSHHTEQSITECINDIVRKLLLDPNVLNRKFKHCSGGEKKRIAIGQELLSQGSKPSLLFVDEPTTGLDCASAFEVIHCLKQLIVHYEMSVIVSIHVPSSEVLAMFDKLYLLAKGGVCIYSGLPHQIKSTISQTVAPNMIITNEHQLPIEIVMKIACNGIADPLVAQLAQHCLADDYNKVSNEISKFATKLHSPYWQTKTFSFNNFALQCYRLYRITFVASYRTQLFVLGLYLFYFSILTTMFNGNMSTATGCMPLKDKNQTCGAVLSDEVLYKENLNFLAYTLQYFGMVMTCYCAAAFSSTVKMFKSEHRNYWYSLGVFYWSLVMINLIEILFYGIFISVLTYFISSQHGADNYTLNWNRFLLYTFFMCLLCLYAQSSGQLIGVVLRDYQNYALIVVLIYFIFASMINGFFVDTEVVKLDIIKLSSDMVALKFVSFGVMYAIYGFERCNPETEFSFVLQFYHTKEANFYRYIAYVLASILVLRTLTLAYMYVCFEYRNLSRKKEMLNPSDVAAQKIEMFLIDFKDEKPQKTKPQADQSDKIISMPSDNIINTEKVILGWKKLTLYETSSVYEFGLANNKSTERENRKTILNNLNGHFCFGTLNALMGTSGAGKTTLLRVLNGQLKTQLSEQTQFYLSKFCQIKTCFIEQEVSGHLWHGLAVKQLLLYSSRLKNLKLPLAEHERIITDLLNELDLMDTANTKVEHCSGGEQKRIALALELTSTVMPNLICIDEPTSGLDSNSAEIVTSCLRKLTRHHNVTIIASIHQPNTRTLLMFDQLYVLARGGVCVYADAPDKVQSHMNNASHIITSSVELKVALEQLIKHSCAGPEDENVRQLTQQQLSQYELNCQSVVDLNKSTQLISDGVTTNRKRFSLQSCYILCLRYCAYIRAYLWKELLFYICYYLSFAYILMWFYDTTMIDISGCIDITESDLNSTCRRTADNVDETNLLLNNTKYSYFMVIFYLVFILLQSSLTLRRELVYFSNEHRNNWYSSGSFYLMKIIFKTLPLIPLNLLYIYFVNYYEHIRPGIYWEFVFILTLSAIGLQGVSHICAIVCANSLIGLIILTITLYLFTTLVGNFFLLHSRLHYFYQFISNFSITKFSFEAVMLLEYGFGRCRPKEIQSVLYIMNLVNEDIYHCIWMLILNLILYRIVAIYLLVRRVNPFENRRQCANRIVEYRKQLQQTTTANTNLWI